MKDVARVDRQRPGVSRTATAPSTGSATHTLLTTPRSPWSRISAPPIAVKGVNDPLLPVRPKTAPNGANDETHSRRGQFIVRVLNRTSERNGHDEAGASRPRTHEGSRHPTDGIHAEGREEASQRLLRYAAKRDARFHRCSAVPD